MTDATHTRESVIEECARVADDKESAWTIQWRAGHKSDSHLEGMSDGAGEVATAIRALKTISTPIPLTPSDEMVKQGAAGIRRLFFEREEFEPMPSYADLSRAVLQAALNLMGGKK